MRIIAEIQYYSLVRGGGVRKTPFIELDRLKDQPEMGDDLSLHGLKTISGQINKAVSGNRLSKQEVDLFTANQKNSFKVARVNHAVGFVRIYLEEHGLDEYRKGLLTIK